MIKIDFEKKTFLRDVLGGFMQNIGKKDETWLSMQT